MLSTLLPIAEAVTLLIAAVGVMGLRPIARQTTLMTVWPWMWVPWLGAVASLALRIGGDTILMTYVDYLTAVAMLSPPLASLGARRPTCRSWPLFVLLPMFAVLLWPAVSIGLATRFGKPLELERPAIVMYCLVLLMGMGNYAFGRCRYGVILLSVFLALHVSGATSMLKFFPPDQFRLYLEAIPTLLCFSLLGVVDTGGRSAHSPAMKSFRLYWPRSSPVEDVTASEEDADPFDAILFEFGELYGLVWSLRLQDRLNVFAEKQKWPGRFEGRRGIWTEPLTESQQAEIERSFRWLFRRFVDPEWLDARLTPRGTPVAKEAFTSPIDS